MSLTLIQMYATAAASSDAAASVDIPEDGEIVGVDWDLNAPTGLAQNDAAEWQLSFISTSQFTTNDARGAISNCSLASGTLTTSGAFTSHTSKFLGLTEGLDVSGGERLYLHLLVTGAVTSFVRCIIHIRTRRATVRRSRRRR